MNMAKVPTSDITRDAQPKQLSKIQKDSPEQASIEK
jgi:hypothetical protein